MLLELLMIPASHAWDADSYTGDVDRDTALRALHEYFQARAHDVAAVYLFGSVARGDAGRASDLDVGILFRSAPPATLEGQPYDIAADLERRVGVPVDVVTLNTAPPDLRIRVLRAGQLAVEHDRSARIRFEVATRNEFFDLEPILTEYRRPRRTA